MRNKQDPIILKLYLKNKYIYLTLDISTDYISIRNILNQFNKNITDLFFYSPESCNLLTKKLEKNIYDINIIINDSWGASASCNIQLSDIEHNKLLEDFTKYEREYYEDIVKNSNNLKQKHIADLQSTIDVYKKNLELEKTNFDKLVEEANKYLKSLEEKYD